MRCEKRGRAASDAGRAFKGREAPSRAVARLTRREWILRIIAVIVAFSFFGSIFYTLFTGF